MSTPDRGVAHDRDADPDDAEVDLQALMDSDEDPDGPALSVALSPRQILGGFALLAGLILLLRRRRSNRSRD